MSPRETKESKGIREMLGEAGSTMKEALSAASRGLNEIEALIVSLTPQRGN
jgi:hypothetical protein